jgi:UDP-N-acetylglucosamine--N-acetylmuramyl-(pentapeptide) pyrophosphoryl-undecaprenol N-acetylglucosamine transferase
MGSRIMIMAGGTGGHVFPALAVAQSLKENGWQVSWLGTKKGLESRVVPKNSIEIDWLSVSGLRGKGRLAILKAPFMLFSACKQAIQVLRARRPDVVLGMGGFVAGPGGLMAKLLGIPLVIHEQNRVPGTTNRLLSGFANTVLEAFPGSFKKQKNAICTGNPLRKEFSNIEKKSNFSVARPLRILVVGGSLGAQVLNQVVPEAAAKIGNVEIKHQTGEKMLDQVQKAYAENNIKVEVLAFIDDMVSVYQWADLIICRAGAMTISEIAAAGLPAILIPFPHAVDDHQTANARYLVEANAGVLIAQDKLNSVLLADQVREIKNNLEEMSKAAKECARLDATEAVAQVCIKEAKQ